MSQIVSAGVSVSSSNGYWTYSYSAQSTGYLLLGFSYKYGLYDTLLADLTPDGTPTGVGNLLASMKLSDCIPDDVECLVGGYHIARFRVNGSLSGSYSAPYSSGLNFSYGKTLKTPILVPSNVDLQLVSKINDFWGSLDLNSEVGGAKGYCSLMPGTAKLVIA